MTPVVFRCLKRLLGGALPRSLHFTLAGLLFFLPFPKKSWGDTVSIYFPPALEASTGITTSTGGSLAGFTVRAGIFTNTPGQLFTNLAGQTSAADIRSTIHASFTQYSSFSMTDAFLSDPDQAVVTFEDPIPLTLRGQDLYLLFYNSASFNDATEMGIFRMATRANVPGEGVGVFPSDDDGFGSRTSLFFFSDPEKSSGPESFLNLLVGQYNATTESYTLGALEGGIGQITSPLTETNASGAVSTYQIVANNGADRFFATTNTASADLTLTNLPAGFSIATNTGVITAGTNAAANTYSIRLVASNSLTASVATNTLTWVLKTSNLSFANGQSSITATLGKGMTSNFTSTGINPTYTVASGKLFGLTLTTSNGVGVLSGAPNRLGSNSVWIQATAGTNVGATNFTLVVNPFSLGIVGLTDAGVLECTAGIAQTNRVTNSEAYTDLDGDFNADPATPGLIFNGSELVIPSSTLPLLKGASNIVLTLTASRDVDGIRVSSSTTVPLRILAPTPTALVGPTEYEVDVGEAFSATILSDAGTYGRMSFSNLPSRLGLVGSPNGTVAGTNNSTSLPFEFPVTVIADSTFDYEGGGIFTSTVTFRLRNTNAPYFASATNRHYPGVGRAISPINLVASNFPFQYNASNLPSGLQLVGATISGTPTTAGRFEVPVVAYNAYRPGSTNPADWQTGTGTLIFHVAGARPPTSVAPTAPGTITRNTTLSIADTNNISIIPGGAENAGVRVAAYGLPPGLSLDPTTGKLFGTTGGPGSYTATVFIQNGRGWIKRNVTLTVQ